MTEFSSEDKIILIQYGIKKYENEETVIEKLKTILPEKDIQRNIDTLIGTQRVRRIVDLKFYKIMKVTLSYQNYPKILNL